MKYFVIYWAFRSQNQENWVHESNQSVWRVLEKNQNGPWYLQTRQKNWKIVQICKHFLTQYGKYGMKTPDQMREEE